MKYSELNQILTDQMDHPAVIAARKVLNEHQVNKIDQISLKLYFKLLDCFVLDYYLNTTCTSGENNSLDQLFDKILLQNEHIRLIIQSLAHVKLLTLSNYNSLKNRASDQLPYIADIIGELFDESLLNQEKIDYLNNVNSQEDLQKMLKQAKSGDVDELKKSFTSLAFIPLSIDEQDGYGIKPLTLENPISKGPK